ncbi:MAG TPA: hypothetical protein PK410_05325 [Paludibacteraceae bacterium]|nr:hypothetical protein [Paludibacteraceae bacterium]
MDFNKELKEHGQLIPVILPEFNSISIFCFPFFAKSFNAASAACLLGAV